VWDSHVAAWLEGYEQLRTYEETNGHCRVPQNFVTPKPDEYPLGRWVATQRQRRRGKQGVLTDDQSTKLEAIGFVWGAMR